MKIFENVSRLILVAFFLFAGFSWAETKAKYSVIITVDGLRPDAISKAYVPNIKSLIENGSYSLGAQTIIPSRTLPAHTSLITGLVPERHGKKSNFWIPLFMNYLSADTIFSITKENDLSNALFTGKDDLKYLVKPKSVDHFESTSRAPTSVKDIVSRFTQYLKTRKPELALIHFPEPDMTGHREGWMSEDYIEALEGVDWAVGAILESLRKSGIYDEAFIVITADHGGHGTDHGSTDRDDMTIPWIAFGKGVKKGYTIKKRIYIYDTAPTVLFALGIEPPQTWDGKTVGEIFLDILDDKSQIRSQNSKK